MLLGFASLTFNFPRNQAVVVFALVFKTFVQAQSKSNNILLLFLVMHKVFNSCWNPYTNGTLHAASGMVGLAKLTCSKWRHRYLCPDTAQIRHLLLC